MRQLNKDTYCIIFCHGEGRRYIKWAGYETLDFASGIAKNEALHLNEIKSPRAPKVKVIVAKVMKVYEGRVKVDERGT